MVLVTHTSVANGTSAQMTWPADLTITKRVVYWIHFCADGGSGAAYSATITNCFNDSSTTYTVSVGSPGPASRAFNVVLPYKGLSFATVGTTTFTLTAGAAVTGTVSIGYEKA